jgi:signal transduction histidine kinase
MRLPLVLVGCLLLVPAYVVLGILKRNAFAARKQAIRAHLSRMEELASLQEALAHELKNPLGAIKGIVGLLELEPARTGERLGVLRGEVERMQRIVDELLTLSRPVVPLAPAEVDVARLARTVADVYDGWARDKGVELQVLAPSVSIRCDGCKVERMLMLLVQNAVETSPSGGIVELALAPGDGGVVLAVRDRGTGAPPPQLPLIRALAEQHQGSLTLARRTGGGTEALLSLPQNCPECPRLV